MKKNNLFSTLLIMPLILTLFHLQAQHTVTGKVIDANTKESIIGANILLEGTATGTITDVDGLFSLTATVPLPWNLEISYIGYAKQTISIEDTNIPLNIVLTTNNAVLEVVMVTANKRLEPAQKVPMSITTLSPKKLKRSGAEKFRDFASGIPNLAFGTSGGGNSGRADNSIAIRGVQGRNTTAVYLDETPLPENIDIRLVDISRVEILKGPQGTLYGARNMGGAVKMITKQPNTFVNNGALTLSGAKVKEGDFDYSLEGTYNIPLSNKFALRLAGYYDFESGVFDRKINTNALILNASNPITLQDLDGNDFNINTDNCALCNLEEVENIDDERNYGFHASLGFFPNKNISIVPKVILQRTSGDGYDFAENRVGAFDQIRASGVNELFKDEWQFYSLSATIQTHLGKFISSSSYLDRFIDETEDTGEANSQLWFGYDGTSVQDFYAGAITRTNDETQFNQEVRFQSELDGKLNFTAGAFYTSSKTKPSWFSQLPGFNAFLQATIFQDFEGAANLMETPIPYYRFEGVYDVREVAFFGEIYYQLAPKLKATVGLRYFDAKTSVNSFEDGFFVGERNEVIGDQKEKGFNPKFNLTYELATDKILYTNVARGFRFGDVNDVVSLLFCSAELASDAEGNPTYPRFYESDYLWNYEMGFKGTWKEGKVMTNAAIFYNDWQNLQLSRALNCGYAYISNVGSASTLGLELEARAKVWSDLEIGGGLGVLNAKINDPGVFSDFVEKDDKILFTPNVTWNLNAAYNYDINQRTNFFVNIDWQHTGERLNTFSPEIPENSFRIFEPYTLLNARMGIGTEQYEISIFGQNLTNTAANFGDPRAFSGEVAGRPRFATNRPITIGLEGSVFF